MAITIDKSTLTCLDELVAKSTFPETRQEIDRDKVAFHGMSWGGLLGEVIPAVEERIKVSVLLRGGFAGQARPEADQINYATRVKTPVLMINGKYDASRFSETSIKAMFDLLGTSPEQKQLKLYGTDHIPPRNEYIKETLAWLDRYLGPVKRPE